MKGSFGQFDLTQVKRGLEQTVTAEVEALLDYSVDRIPYDNWEKDDFHLREETEIVDTVTNFGLSVKVNIHDERGDEEPYSDDINYGRKKLRSEDGNKPGFYQDIAKEGERLFKDGEYTNLIKLKRRR